MLQIEQSDLMTLEKQGLILVESIGFFQDIPTLFKSARAISSFPSSNRYNSIQSKCIQNQSLKVSRLLDQILNISYQTKGSLESSIKPTLANNCSNTKIESLENKRVTDIFDETSFKIKRTEIDFKDQFELMKYFSDQVNIYLKIYSTFRNNLTSRKIGKKSSQKLFLFMNEKVEFTLLLKTCNRKYKDCRCNIGEYSFLQQISELKPVDETVKQTVNYSNELQTIEKSISEGRNLKLGNKLQSIKAKHNFQFSDDYNKISSLHLLDSYTILGNVNQSQGDFTSKNIAMVQHSKVI